MIVRIGESLKRCNDWNLNLRPDYGLSQVLSMPAGDAGTEWFEAPEPGWKGYATHAGGIRMSQVPPVLSLLLHTCSAARFVHSTPQMPNQGSTGR